MNVFKKNRSAGVVSVIALVTIVLVAVGAIFLVQNILHHSTGEADAAVIEKTFTIGLTEDSYVSSASRNTNFGTSQTLLSGERSKYISYFKADFSSLRNKKLISAVFKMKISDSSVNDQRIVVVNGNWNENSVNYVNRPQLGSTVLSFKTTSKDTFTSVDLSQFLSKANLSQIGVVSFAITSEQADSAGFYSNNSAYRPIFEFVETVTVSRTPSPTDKPMQTPGSTPVPTTQPTATAMPSGMPMPTVTGTPAPNGSGPAGGFGIGSGDGLEVGINLAKFNQAKADAAAGVYDRPCTAAEHDKNLWHSLVNPVAKCHYDHEHGDDPNYVNDVFGAPGAWFNKSGQSISYPWQTFSLPATTTESQALGLAGTDGQKENDQKHQGYYWVVRRGQTCDGGQFCITDSRLEFHFMSSHHNEVGVRSHSFSFEGRLCQNPNDSSTCGIYRTGGWTDHGQLFITAPENECWTALNGAREGKSIPGQMLIPLPVDTQFFPLDFDGLVDEFRCHKTITSSIVQSFPNGYNLPAAEWWTHGASDFRYVIRVYDPISNVDPSSPTGVTGTNAPFCAQSSATCRWNNSNMTAGQGYTTQLYADYEGTTNDTNGDNKTDLTFGRVFMNRFGGRNRNCTQAGLDCIPLMITNVPLDGHSGNQRYSNRQCETCARLDHDLTPAGRPSWIDWFYKM